MNYCKACGRENLIENNPDLCFGTSIDHICHACTERFYSFWRHYNFKPRKEAALANWLATQLHNLAVRKMKGQPILFCQAIVWQNKACDNFAREVINGAHLCSIHIRMVNKYGHLPKTLTASSLWAEQI